MSKSSSTPGQLEFSVGGRKQTAGRTWYRGEHCNFNPAMANMRSVDTVERFILEGWLPDGPFITPDTRITAFGSCFAENISKYLNSRKYTVLTKSESNAYVVSMGEGIVNSYAMRQQFDWAFRGLVPQTELWHGYKGEHFGYREDLREETLKLFNTTDVFVLTFGLSEVWYDEPTGEVLWRAVPAAKYDPSRHKFRVTTVDENKQNVRVIYDSIREFRPEAKIIFTLSPIPLVATFRPVSCIAANAVSKAVLRAAIDEVYREVAHEGRLFYWPSYEIVQEAFGPGKYGIDRRHIKKDVLDYIMLLFEKHYCSGSDPGKTVTEAFLRARLATGEIAPDALRVARRDDLAALSAFVEESLASDDPETAELVLTYALECHPDSLARLGLLETVRNAERAAAVTLAVVAAGRTRNTAAEESPGHDVQALKQIIADQDRQIAHLQGIWTAVQNSAGWRVLEEWRRLRWLALPMGTRRRRYYEWALRSLRRTRTP